MNDPRSTGRDRRPERVWALAAALLLAAGTAAGQIPDRFENLEVLPKDVGKQELVEVMKSFCAALDVRCTHCHVGEEGAPLSEIDFASDQKHDKQATRVMMRMVEAINGTYLPKLGHHESERLEVSCVTCHRGQAKPQSLERVLFAAVKDHGQGAALARYRELRERYYGSATFDFSAATLTRLANHLAAADQVPAAVAFLEVNVEFYPQEMMSYFFLGDLHAKNGDQAKAIESFEKALALEPKNPIVARRLEMLKGS